MANKSDESTSKAVDKVRKYTDEELLSISSFDDALNLARNLYGDENIVTADQVIGNGFHIVRGEQGKMGLIGTPMLFMEWRMNPTELAEKGYFASALAVTREGRKLIINDGGAGICEQLNSYSAATGRFGGMYVPNGLTVSEYEWEDEKGVSHPGKTFYLDTSPS